MCFKYAPGNWQHMESFAVRAEENGFSVRFVVSRCFCWMMETFSDSAVFVTRSDRLVAIVVDTLAFVLYRWVGLWRSLRRARPRVVILVMWHPLNAVFALMARRAAGSRVVVWMHEPYKTEKRLYGTKALVFYMVEWVQSLSLPWIDDVVVHSEAALKAFRLRYPNARHSVHLTSLQFQDRPGPQAERRFVSFFGKAAKAKGSGLFFDLVEAAAVQNLPWVFAIATGDDVGAYVDRLSPAARERLEVIQEPNLSDAMLREVASRSIAVLCLYSSSMQSGVVPVAFMCGAPVVATDIPALQACVDEGRTGCFVPQQPAIDAVFEAVGYIEQHLVALSANCRQEFLRTYDDRNWQAAYGWLIGQPHPGTCSVHPSEKSKKILLEG